jgi:hypothetical protein
MNKELSALGITMSILLLAVTTSSVTAQNYTTNASNAMGNASASVNQSASEVGQNMSNAVGIAPQPANQTAERGENVSIALNKTAEPANATLSELGKNVTDAGKTALNKTVEVAKGIGSGAEDVLGNITGEISGK